MKISGAIDVPIEEIVEEHYMKRAVKKGKDGLVVYAAAFEWISTSEYLAQQDRFQDDGMTKKSEFDHGNSEATKHREWSIEFISRAASYWHAYIDGD